MHIGRHIVQELVFTFGEPLVARWEIPLTASEFDEVELHRSRGRAHDVTLVIPEEERIAVIRKKGYPEGAYRFPSGGIHPEESFLDGSVREALEETGLVVSIEDYLLQVLVGFANGDRHARWTTHVMLAKPAPGELSPRDDSEIEAARWLDWTELIEVVNPLLRDSGRGGLAYRARIHEETRDILSRRDSGAGKLASP